MNSKYSKHVTQAAVLVVLIIGQPVTAFAYVGPGAGLSIIGSLLAFFAAIFIGIFGFIWFPIRRVLRKRKQAKAADAAELAIVADRPVDEPGVDDIERGGPDA